MELKQEQACRKKSGKECSFAFKILLKDIKENVKFIMRHAKSIHVFLLQPDGKYDLEPYMNVPKKRSAYF
jgi:hypothetical protein